MSDHGDGEPLAAGIADSIADALERAGLPDRLYGLVLAYSLGDLSAYTWPLFACTRAAMLAQGEEPYALWDPSWARAEQLPPGMSEDLPDRDLRVPLPHGKAYAEYRGQPRDDPAALERVARLWRDVAAVLTRRRWSESAVTDDFVALAYPNEWREADVVEALRASLGPDRFAAFAARGWVPQ